MKIRVLKEIFDKYPKTEIGYLVAEINVKKTDNYIENLKNNLFDVLKANNIDSKNYANNRQIDGWRNVFKDFGMSHKTHRSSLESLVKRIVTGSKIWNISSIVDLYNCCSVLSLLPMGGYDIDKLKDNITIRYGKDNDSFDPLGMDGPVAITNQHVVYSDDERVICWLWNFRDSKHTSISDETKHAIFFLDSAFEIQHITMLEALQLFEEGLTKLGSKVTCNGVLSANNPQVELAFDKPVKNIESKFGLFEAILKKKHNINSNHKVEDKKSISNNEKKEFKSVDSNFIPAPIEKLATKQMAIHLAATGNLETLKSILNHDPKLIETKDWYGNNLLMHAVVNGHHDTIKWLISEFTNKINLNEKNKNNQTAFDLALRYNDTNTFDLLKSF